MSSSVPSKRLHAPNTLPAGKGILNWLVPVLNSTVGAKIIVAITGLGLTAFVIAHLIGNLKLLGGRDAINSYARFIKDFGPWLWVMRIGLLVTFVLHILLVLRLKERSSSARPIPYRFTNTIQASVASRSMIYTGLVILAFVLFHLAHYTFGYIGSATATDLSTNTVVETNYLNLVDQQGRHDVYSMMVAGFRHPLIALLYVLAQIAVFMHLSHGVASTLQTLGLNTPRLQPAIRVLGYVVALFVAVGNIALVAAVWTGNVPVLEAYANKPN